MNRKLFALVSYGLAQSTTNTEESNIFEKFMEKGYEEPSLIVDRQDLFAAAEEEIRNEDEFMAKDEGE